MKTLLNFLKILAVILASVLSLTISLSISRMPLPTLIQISGFKMHVFSEQLFNTHLPQSTTFIEKTTVDNYRFERGNADCSEYAAVILVESELSLEELNSYYSRATAQYFSISEICDSFKPKKNNNDFDDMVYYNVSPVTTIYYFLELSVGEYRKDQPIKSKYSLHLFTLTHLL